MARRLREQIQVNPIDTKPNVAVGIALPFNARAVFNLNYTTKDQVRSNLINFFLTNKGERIMNPEFGGDLRTFIFEQLPEFDRLDDYISELLLIYFPQITKTGLDINVDKDAQSVSVSLDYSINNSSDNITIQFHA